MNHHHEFHPDLNEAELERRIVPSQAAEVAPMAGSRSGGARAEIGAQYIQQFQRQFAEFSNAYATAAANILFADGDSGTTANRPDFDAAVLSAANRLMANLSSLLSLSPLAARTGLLTAVQQSVGGDGPDSLVNTLAALPTPTDASGASADAFGAASANAINSTLENDLAGLTAFISSGNPARQGVGPSAESIQGSYVRQFQRAFADFASSYSDAVSGTLFAGGAGQIAANRPDFDAQVNQDLFNLVDDLTSMLSLSPRAAANLTPSIQNLVVGSGPNSLGSQLAALSSPSDIEGETAFTLGQEASTKIDQAFRQAVAQLNRFASDPARGRIPVPAFSLGLGEIGTGQGTGNLGGSTGSGQVGNGAGGGSNTGSGSNGSNGSGAGGGSNGGNLSNGGTIGAGGSLNGTGGVGGTANGGGVSGPGVFGSSFFNGLNQGAGFSFRSNTALAANQRFDNALGNAQFGNGVASGVLIPLGTSSSFFPASGPFTTLGNGFLGAFPTRFTGGSGTGTGFNPGFGSNAALGTGFNFGSGTSFGSNAGLGLGFPAGFGSSFGRNAGMGVGFGSSFGGSNFTNNAGEGLGGPTFTQDLGFGNSTLGDSAGLQTGPGTSLSGSGGVGFGGETGPRPSGNPGGPPSTGI